MDWGTKIVMALALFMIMIMSFGVYMLRHDTDSLVAPDYYERGLKYDSLQRVSQPLTAADTLMRLKR
ncbi:FixH protein [Parapedobacter composti]|uniref:FixH protein n=1 Tax=Parapedobacter composti TaxID=623281 RepID=A0A1I1EAP1_9SPHI|nr:FixH family protein [Parapedobacter composti]SFB84189.1 FixH protein [Parapedobacter composti]